jgi:hypothetical protein
MNCGFTIPWRGKCEKLATNGRPISSADYRCAEHASLMCSDCAKRNIKILASYICVDKCGVPICYRCGWTKHRC